MIQNGELNTGIIQKEEFLFIENSRELYDIYGATCAKWATKLINKNDDNGGRITIFVPLENDFNKIPFNKSDLKKLRKIYSIIKIYFNSNFANIICNKNNDGDSILFIISSSPLKMNWIMNKLLINPVCKNQLLISEINEFNEDFDKIYKIEIGKNLKCNNKLNPNSEVKTKCVFNNLKNNNIDSVKNITYIQNNINDRKDLNPQKLKNNSKVNMKNNQIANINNNMILNNNNFYNNINNNINNQNNNMNNNINFINNQNPNNICQNNPNVNTNQIQQNMMFFNNNQQFMMNQMNLMNQMNQLMNLQMNNNNLCSNNLLNMNNQNNFQNNNILEKYVNYNKEMKEKASKILELNLLKNKENLYFSKKGLSNVGLTCYMNSTLQCLLHIVELSYYIVNSYNEFKREYLNIIAKTETKGQLSDEYKKILDNVLIEKEEKGFFRNFRSDSFEPWEFNKLIGRLNPQFKRYEANDAKDLIIYLLQEMHEELNYYGGKRLDKIPKCNQLNEADAFNFFYEVNSTLNFSIISYLFWGIVKQTTTCSVCKNKLYNFQYFQYLSFPLYNYTKIKFNFYQGLKDYTKKEILKGDNKFYCQICRGLREAEVKSVIYYPPQYLLINFDYGKDKKYKPEQINFGSSIYITKEFLNTGIDEANYDLVAVSSHIGSSGSSGHYIAFCKDAQNNWHKFNDSSHSFCNFEDTYNYSPYLLIYKKIN